MCFSKDKYFMSGDKSNTQQLRQVFILATKCRTKT